MKTYSIENTAYITNKGQIIGAITTDMTDGRKIYSWVAPEYRGQGVGKELYRAIKTLGANLRETTTVVLSKRAVAARKAAIAMGETTVKTIDLGARPQPKWLVDLVEQVVEECRMVAWEEKWARAEK